MAVWIIICLIFCGCQSQEPALSPAARAFKSEIKECIDRLSGPLIGPITNKDLKAINETLATVEPQVVKLCRMCPFRIGALDRDGDTLATYPMKTDTGFNFSGYELVAQTIKNRKISQQRFFLQDGSEIYIICAPLLDKEELVGLLAINLSAEEAKARWGLSQKEFLALDFNK
jgi:hypothetical protein